MWQHVVVEQLEKLRKSNGGTFDVEIRNDAVVASYGSMHGVKILPQNGGYHVIAWNHSAPYNGGTYELPEHAAIAAFAALRVVG
jgi:hypothetical protein